MSINSAKKCQGKNAIDRVQKHQWIESKKSPTQAELQLSSPAVKYFWINKPLLEAKDGVLFYRWVDEVKESQLLIVPHS